MKNQGLLGLCAPVLSVAGIQEHCVPNMWVSVQLLVLFSSSYNIGPGRGGDQLVKINQKQLIVTQASNAHGK